jgi:hypothetical protein
MNEETVRRLRTLQPAAKAANGFAAVTEVISDLIAIVPVQRQTPAPLPGPLTLLAALPLLQSLLPEIRSLRVQRGDESVGFEWDAEIELEDGIRFGEGNCAAGAILCATIEILSGQLPV